MDIWADWTTHIPYILNFAYGPFPLPYHPQFWGESFRYHFAADLVSGLLMKLGLSLTQVAVFPSIISSELLIIALYLFFLNIYKNKATAIISSLIFLFNGGLGLFIAAFSPSPLWPMMTRNDAQGIRWMNFFLAEFIPQRAFLLGAPITIGILTALWKIFNDGIQKFSRRHLLILGVVSGLLPVIHFHSFFVILFVSAYLFALPLLYRKVATSWIWFFLPLLLVSGWILSSVFGGVPASNIRFEIGAIRQSFTSLPIIPFWIINLGIMTILIPIAFLKASPKIRTFYIPFLILFILSNMFSFQKDAWDNRKFLLYWYLASSGLVGYFLYNLARTKGFLVAIILFYLATISGFIDAASTLNSNKQKYPMFSAQDMALAQTVRSKTDVNDVFLTAPTNTYFSLTIGRQIVMGWEHWLQNYGYETTQRAQDIKDIYTGEPSARDLIKKYSIDYIVVGPTERKIYQINDSIFQSLGTVFLKNDTLIIYNIANRTPSN